MALAPDRPSSGTPARRTRSGRWICCCSPTWAWSRVVAVLRAPAQPGAGGSSWRTCSSSSCCSWSPARARAGGPDHPRDLSRSSYSGLYSELDILNSGRDAGPRRVVQQWELCSSAARSAGMVAAAAEPILVDPLSRRLLSYYLIVSAPALYFAWRRRPGRGPAFRPGGHRDLRHLLSGLHLLPGGGTLLQFPRPPLGSSTISGPARLRGPRHRQLLRRGLPLLPRGRGLAATLAAARSSAAWALSCCPHPAADDRVVYCQMHYGVDALAGLLVGAMVMAWSAVGRRVSERER